MQSQVNSIWSCSSWRTTWSSFQKLLAFCKNRDRNFVFFFPLWALEQPASQVRETIITLIDVCIYENVPDFEARFLTAENWLLFTPLNSFQPIFLHIAVGGASATTALCLLSQLKIIILTHKNFNNFSSAFYLRWTSNLEKNNEQLKCFMAGNVKLWMHFSFLSTTTFLIRLRIVPLNTPDLWIHQMLFSRWASYGIITNWLINWWKLSIL